MKKYLIKIYLNILFFKNNILAKFFVRTPFLSSLYYLLFSSQFRREHHAVLKGRLNHVKYLNKNKSNIYTLIRNTHRIEKGLLMKPRRDIFALDYIEETVNTFINIWDFDKQKNNSQYKWFFDVLDEYFSSSGQNTLINQLSDKFYKKTAKNISSENNKMLQETSVKAIPYFREKSKNPNISYQDFYKLTKYRRSVRWFLKKKVPRELIDQALLSALQSPSACNRQPFEYRVIDDLDLLKEVANLPGGVRGYAEGIPMMIVSIGNLDAYFDERDRHIIYIDASLANMTFMLALETLGLSSCAINWPDVEHLEKRMEKVLNLKKDQRPIMCMAVGYPDPEGKVAFSEKRTLDNIRKYNYDNSN